MRSPFDRLLAHADLPDAGRIPHHQIDDQLPTSAEKDVIRTLDRNGPQSVTGARSDPEQALANLLSALEVLGLISDDTSAT